MKDLDNTEERLAIINEMIEIVRRDSPWVWGFHPKNFVLSHAWNSPTKPNVMANNTLKYQKLDATMREKLRREWNFQMTIN